jgi:hypothetical protein
MHEFHAPGTTGSHAGPPVVAGGSPLLESAESDDVAGSTPLLDSSGVVVIVVVEGSVLLDVVGSTVVVGAVVPDDASVAEPSPSSPPHASASPMTPMGKQRMAASIADLAEPVTRWMGGAVRANLARMLRPDFAAYDEAGHVQVTIEAKRRPGTAADWAAAFRRNAVMHGWLPIDSIFILVTPDKLYAWDRDVDVDAAPSTELAADTLFRPYYERVGTSPSSIGSEAFELLVSWWLDDVARKPADEVASVLGKTALAEALSGSRIVRQDAA